MACILREEPIHTANPKPRPGRRKTGIDAAQVVGGRLESTVVGMWPQGGDGYIGIMLGGGSFMEHSPLLGPIRVGDAKLLGKVLGYSQSFHLFGSLSCRQAG